MEKIYSVIISKEISLLGLFYEQILRSTSVFCTLLIMETSNSKHATIGVLGRPFPVHSICLMALMASYKDPQTIMKSNDKK
jgi:hypothetical protein